MLFYFIPQCYIRHQSMLFDCTNPFHKPFPLYPTQFLVPILRYITAAGAKWIS
jgi:hypothetical protein